MPRRPRPHEISAALAFYEDLGREASAAAADPASAARPAWTWSEQYRHECEVRYVKTFAPERLKEYLEGVARHRGAAAAARLRRDVYA